MVCERRSQALDRFYGTATNTSGSPCDAAVSGSELTNISRCNISQAPPPRPAPASPEPPFPPSLARVGTPQRPESSAAAGFLRHQRIQPDPPLTCSRLFTVSAEDTWTLYDNRMLILTCDDVQSNAPFPPQHR